MMNADSKFGSSTEQEEMEYNTQLGFNTIVNKIKIHYMDRLFIVYCIHFLWHISNRLNSEKNRIFLC